MGLDLYGRVVDFFRTRKRNYQLAFGSPAGQEVLKDLARFCRAFETTCATSPEASTMLEGRRQVWLRIQNHMNLSSEELVILNKVALPQGDTNG